MATDSTSASREPGRPSALARATSQDVMDSAMILVARRALAVQMGGPVGHRDLGGSGALIDRALAAHRR